MRMRGLSIIVAGAGVALAAARLLGSRRFSFEGRTVVIAGGSRGLGLVLARQLAREGARLVLLARNQDELRRAEQDLIAAGADVLTVACDIRREDDVIRALAEAADRFGRIDVLINNAGIIQVGPLEHMTAQDFRDSLEVHAIGPVHTILAALPYLRRHRDARIVNISSIGAEIAVPHLAPYCAGKFALAGLSRTLYSELSRSNIHVTTVYPGLMRTGSPPNALFKGRHRDEYAWFGISDALPLLSVSAERAARQIIEGCRRGSSRVVVGVPAAAVMFFNRLFPRTTARLLALIDRLLPGPAPEESAEAYTGWQSQSRWAPSRLTALSDRATRANNEQPQPTPGTPETVETPL